MSMRPVNLSLDDESHAVWITFERGTRSKYIRAVLKDARNLQAADMDKEQALKELAECKKAIRALTRMVDANARTINWEKRDRNYYRELGGIK